MKKTIIALLAPALGVAPAFAGDVSAPIQSPPPTAANNYGLSPYIGVSGIYGEFEEVTETEAYDVAGVRVNGGLGFGNGFSIDGQYEHVEGDISIKSDEFRALLNYEQAIARGFSLFGGIGYGWLSQEASVEGELLEFSGNGILLNAGANFSSGRLFGSLVYTHCLTQSFELDGSKDYELVEEDLGYFEVSIGYNINEQLAATLAVETQVTGDTIIDKNWVAALGLQYKF
jgi:hypothetical protein